MFRGTRLISRVIIFIVAVGIAIVQRLVGGDPNTITTLNLKPGDSFTESFTDNHNNWNIADTDNARYTLAGGAYTIAVKRTDWATWPGPSLLFPENIDVQVDATLPNVDPSVNWGVGIAIRAPQKGSEATFYVYEITATGMWRFRVHLAANEWKTIASGKIGYFVDPKQTHTLRIIAKGNAFTLGLNGKQITQITDDTLKSDNNPKYLKLYATNIDTGLTEVQFRNLKVWIPE